MFGSRAIVHKFAFIPDAETIIPTHELPDGVQELTIKTHDNVNIMALYLPNTASKKLLIYFHGNSGNIYHRIESLQTLQRFGVNVLGMSYRGYAKSEGKPTETGIYTDGKATLDYAINNMGFAKEDIILFGRSIGSTVAIHLAQYAATYGVIAVTPFTSAKEMAKTMGLGLGLISPLAGKAFDNLGKVSAIQSPFLVIHGTKDTIIPYSMGERVFANATGTSNKLFIRIENADHNDMHYTHMNEYWLPIKRFIQADAG